MSPEQLLAVLALLALGLLAASLAFVLLEKGTREDRRIAYQKIKASLAHGMKNKLTLIINFLLKILQKHVVLTLWKHMLKRHIFPETIRNQLLKLDLGTKHLKRSSTVHAPSAEMTAAEAED